jgi:type II secretory pathway pseudopilin PulG
MTRVHRRCRRRRGGLLLEVVIALALLVMVGLFALGGARDGLAATERAERRAAAVDLAASRLAEIEAGIVSIDAIGDLQDTSLDEETGGFEDEPPRWPFAVAVETGPSGFDGLVRVEVVVRLDDDVEDPIELARLVTLIDDRSEVDRTEPSS